MNLNYSRKCDVLAFFTHDNVRAEMRCSVVRSNVSAPVFDFLFALSLFQFTFILHTRYSVVKCGEELLS